MFTSLSKIMLSLVVMTSTTAGTFRQLLAYESDKCAVIQEPARHQTDKAQSYGYVADELYEGYAKENDIYLIEVDGYQFEMEADDLLIGDPVTVYYSDGMPVRIVYGWR